MTAKWNYTDLDAAAVFTRTVGSGITVTSLCLSQIGRVPNRTEAIEDGGAAVGANGLNVMLDAQLVADIKSIAPSVKVAVRRTSVQQITARGSGNSRCVKFGRAHLAQTFTENASREC